MRQAPRYQSGHGSASVQAGLTSSTISTDSSVSEQASIERSSGRLVATLHCTFQAMIEITCSESKDLNKQSPAAISAITHSSQVATSNCSARQRWSRSDRSSSFACGRHRPCLGAECAMVGGTKAMGGAWPYYHIDS